MSLCPDCQGVDARFLQDCYALRGAEGITVLSYTKGKILNYAEQEVFYVLISSKRSTD